MKISFIILFFIAILYACNNGLQSQLQQLNADWQNLAAATDQYATDLTQTYTRMQQLRDTMGLPPGSLQRLGEAKRASVQNLLKNMYNYNKGLIDLGREFSTFSQNWQQQTQRLNQLSIAVKNRQALENQNIPTEIAALQTQLRQATTALQNWLSRLQQFKTNMEADYTQFLQQSATLQ